MNVHHQGQKRITSGATCNCFTNSYNCNILGYISIIVIFAFEIDFEFAMVPLAVIGRKEMHHYPKHKAFDR
ncbi:MAG TPA: hypothetical protein VFI73_04885, partial [Candidatus Nitrosopolaris sp.]|nr:hypothetical protein [Candidatus Nitrosopolaris sp.]